MPHIDADFPGGNILCERIDGDDVWLRQDWRNCTEWWFYWYFRVRDAAGRPLAGKTLRFHFSDGDVFSAGGPCFSADGKQWRWLGREILHSDDNSRHFAYSFPTGCDSAFFSLCIPYVQSHLEEFLEQHSQVQRHVLTRSEKGRDVERLALPSRHGTYLLPIIARSHACEAMANYVIEGIIEYSLGSAENAAAFLREHVDVQVVPFLDTDGVEDGDQGKFRAPHDHNRDYTAQPIYNATRALMQQLPQWRGEIVVAMDVHCPWIRGGINEQLATVGMAQPWQSRLDRFMALLEQTQRGVLKFRAGSYTPFGHEWNRGAPHSFNGFMQQRFPQAASWALEIPYARAGTQEMTVEAARAFGHDVARATALYIEQEHHEKT